MKRDSFLRSMRRPTLVDALEILTETRSLEELPSARDYIERAWRADRLRWYLVCASYGAFVGVTVTLGMLGRL